MRMRFPSGIVTNFDWKNPHIELYMVVEDEDGSWFWLSPGVIPDDFPGVPADYEPVPRPGSQTSPD